MIAAEEENRAAGGDFGEIGALRTISRGTAGVEWRAAPPIKWFSPAGRAGSAAIGRSGRRRWKCGFYPLKDVGRHGEREIFGVSKIMDGGGDVFFSGQSFECGVPLRAREIDQFATGLLAKRAEPFTCRPAQQGIQPQA